MFREQATCMWNSSREVLQYRTVHSGCSFTRLAEWVLLAIISPLSPSIRLWSLSIRWWSSAGAWHQLPSLLPLSSGDIAELWRTKLHPGHLAAFSTDCSHISKRASTFHVSATSGNVLYPFTFHLLPYCTLYLVICGVVTSVVIVGVSYSWVAAAACLIAVYRWEHAVIVVHWWVTCTLCVYLDIYSASSEPVRFLPELQPSPGSGTRS